MTKNPNPFLENATIGLNLHDRYPAFKPIYAEALASLNLPWISLPKAVMMIKHGKQMPVVSADGATLRRLSGLLSHLERMLTGYLWWLVTPEYVANCIVTVAKQVED